MRNFVSSAASIAELAHRAKSHTQSLNHSPSLFDAPGTEVFVLQNITDIPVLLGVCDYCHMSCRLYKLLVFLVSLSFLVPTYLHIFIAIMLPYNNKKLS